ncbi:MAG: flagellar assembly protein FliW [Anaeromicrobium sp.]|uniref:flagellar assembly protein FliW n=1 Tax=Anaeromicrobium sp. TaxID=1929132 RepID=UPI0025D6441C|nr:flagellar assembly protein FliW [Anaeromicrobium sp.]MCT4595416.1 flagellar assembly protein FliW [Anaeromicrobium sp.]
MFIETKHFGKIEVIEENIINFEEGLFGFEELKKYLYISNEDKENPFNWIQSIENPDLAFVITDPFIFNKEYDFYLDEAILEKLKISKKEQVGVYSIVVIPENIKNMTMNLKAPIIVNIEECRAMQVALKEDYPIKYKILEV